MASKSKSFPGFSGRPGRDPAQEHLKLLLELLGNIGEVLWLRDLKEERLLYVSPAFATIWGRSVETLLNSPRVWIESIHPADRDRVLSAALNEARSAHDRLEYRVVRPDKSVRWVYDRSYPVRNAQGEIYRQAGVVEDITEQRSR